jgi:ABC-type dipeptide/oligopeptide/nickel transport system permease subunit
MQHTARPEARHRPRTRLARFWNARPVRKLRRDRLAVACMAVILAYLMTSILVWLGAFEAYYQAEVAEHANATAQAQAFYEARVGQKYLEPSSDAWYLWLGTDRQGRSILVRAMYSARTAIGVGLVSALLGVLLGTLLGGLAGYFGRRVDELIVWLYSTLESIPYLLLLIAITYSLQGVFSDGLTRIYIAFGATFCIGPCRLVRGEVLKLREAEYVQAARAMGYGDARILLRHILPNTMHVVLVNFALLFVSAIKAEVILSFLGLGVQGEPSWGIMIDNARAELVNGFYWQIGAATCAMFGLVLCFNLFADALQDALDPKTI